MDSLVNDTLEASPNARYSNIDKAQAKLLRRLNSAGMTKEGEDWLIAALDPYHDKALELAGYPDGSRERSIVQVVKRDLDIAKPASLAIGAGETWDAHIFVMPNLQTEKASAGTAPAALWSHYSGNNIRVAADPSVDTEFGNVNVVYVKTGQPSWCEGRIYPGSGTDIGPINDGSECVINALSPDAEVGGDPNTPSTAPTVMSSDYTSGLHRVIGQGMELTNTSKILDMEGSVTVYGQSSRAFQRVGAIYNNAGGYTPAREIVRCSGPPSSADKALNLPGSRLWHSKYGAYVVSRFQDDELPYSTYESADVIWDGGLYTPLGSPSDPLTSAGCCLATVRKTGPGLTSARPPLNRSFDLSKDQRGIYITQQGLDAKFKLTVRWIIESSATVTKPGLVVLQPPSPALDPIARALYSEAMRLSPPGMRLDENAFGTWFREAASNVLQALGPTAKVALPMAATALTGSPAGGMLASHLLSNMGGAGKKARKARGIDEEIILREHPSRGNRKAQASKKSGTATHNRGASVEIDDFVKVRKPR